jgi:predicted translin family RNA/ssDNA-binding protein
MPNRDKLKDAAVRIGTAVGRADAKAHLAAQKASNAIDVAKQELDEITKQVDALKAQLARSSKRLQDSLK